MVMTPLTHNHKRKHKRVMLSAFIAGMEMESQWGFKWSMLPLDGRYSRLRFFLKWYNLKYGAYGIN